MVTVVGLGNNDGDITLKGACAIDAADTVIVKTALTDTYKFFDDIDNVTCDFIYEKTADFEELNAQLAAYVLSFNDKDVVYCVNGSGYDDRSVEILTQLEKNVTIIPSVGRESIALADKPNTCYLAVSAYELDDESFEYDSAKTVLVIKDIDNEFIAGNVKSFLSRLIGEETAVTCYDGNKSHVIPVYELDRLDSYSYETCVRVNTVPLLDKQVFNYTDIMRIMRVLRGENGCEWDKAQTHASIRKNVIEEAYELVEAINNDDTDNIIEESGDVILQGIFHTIIGEEEGEFAAHEVLSALGNKLVSRHPHVFGDAVANNEQEALDSWTAAKAKEKKTKSTADKMRKVIGSMPQLLRADKLQTHAAKAGLDFSDIGGVVDKIGEETREVLNAHGEEIEAECGDLLFSAVNLARFKGVNAEVALAKSNEKFINRIAFVLDKCEELGLDSHRLTEKEFESIWDLAKEKCSR